MVFSWQSGSSPVGGTIACNVSLEDDLGNLVTNDSSTVTVALSGAGGGSLQGTVSVPVVGGVASFSGLSVDRAGNYKLVATDGTLTAATSWAFTITPPATHLAFLAGPTSGMPGVTLAPISVAVEDASGTIVTNYIGSIGLHEDCLTSSFSSSQTLQGTTTVDVQNGIATFSNVSLDVEGTYDLFAAVTGAEIGTTLDNVTIGSVAPPRLVFSRQPFGTLRAGQPVGLLGVSIWDSSSQVEVRNGSNITVNVQNSSGAVVQMLTEAAQSGMADFSGTHLSGHWGCTRLRPAGAA